MAVRIKMRCSSVSSGLTDAASVLHGVQFVAVDDKLKDGDDPNAPTENQAFAREVPAGQLQFASIAPLPFKPGACYYVDIVPETGEGFALRAVPDVVERGALPPESDEHPMVKAGLVRR